VEIAGPDASLVTQRNGELLRALEHIAAKMVRLEPEEHDRISFDSGNFKAIRAREMKMAAEAAAERVRRSGAPYSFQPMSSRERRMLHLAFRQFDDLETESSGEGLRRFVVVYRKGDKHVPPASVPSFQRGRGGRDSRGGGRGGDRRGGGRGGDRRGPRGPRR
jgi:spoIIIJ-associated protein